MCFCKQTFLGRALSERHHASHHELDLYNTDQLIGNVDASMGILGLIPDPSRSQITADRRSQQMQIPDPRSPIPDPRFVWPLSGGYARTVLVHACTTTITSRILTLAEVSIFFDVLLSHYRSNLHHSASVLVHPSHQQKLAESSQCYGRKNQFVL